MAMHPYTEYTLENFLQDSLFQRWVTDPTPQDEAFWSQWLLEYPDKREIVEQARLLILSIQSMQHLEIGEDEAQREIQHILAQSEESFGRDEVSRIPSVNFGSGWLRIAASISVLMGIAWWLVSTREKVNPGPSISKVATQANDLLVVRTNNTASPQLVNLSDGSTIILQKNSQVTYPKVFKGNSREVYLLGEAFFEVSKNPESPFYVHAREVVTKVLGTSFYVKIDSIRRRVTVSVKTGKVSVYTTSAERTPASALKGTPDAILSPNQQIVYGPENEKSVKPVVNLTHRITLPIPDTHFTFNSTPVPQVFAALEKAYGVHIAFNQESLKHCSITATLTDEPLTTKLELICKSIGLNYRMENAEVAITGKGCLQ